MADGGGVDQFIGDWVLGFKSMVFSQAGEGSATGGAEAATNFVAGFGWSEGTWTKLLNQIRRWLAFRAEEDWAVIPAFEGDVIAYIGYLSLDGKVGPVSVRHFVTAVSRCL